MRPRLNWWARTHLLPENLAGKSAFLSVRCTMQACAFLPVRGLPLRLRKMPGEFVLVSWRILGAALSMRRLNTTWILVPFAASIGLAPAERTCAQKRCIHHASCGVTKTEATHNKQARAAQKACAHRLAVEGLELKHVGAGTEREPRPGALVCGATARAELHKA